MALLTDVTPSQALVRGYDRFLMQLSNWGNDGASADPESTNTGPQNYSIAGIAIDPESEVDALSIHSQVTRGFQLVTVGNPYIGDIPGPWTGSTANLNYRWEDIYYPWGTVISAPFGPTMGTDPNGRPIFGGRSASLSAYPELRLIVYLRPPGTVPMSQGPMQDIGGNMLVPSVNPDTVVRVLFVNGRKRLRALFKQTAAGVFNIYLTGSMGWTFPAIVPPALTGATAEFVLTPTQTSAAVGAETTFDLTVPPNVMWLFIKFTVTTGTPEVAWWINTD